MAQQKVPCEWKGVLGLRTPDCYIQSDQLLKEQGAALNTLLMAIKLIASAKRLDLLSRRASLTFDEILSVRTEWQKSRETLERESLRLDSVAEYTKKKLPNIVAAQDPILKPHVDDLLAHKVLDRDKVIAFLLNELEQKLKSSALSETSVEALEYVFEGWAAACKAYGAALKSKNEWDEKSRDAVVDLGEVLQIRE